MSQRVFHPRRFLLLFVVLYGVMHVAYLWVPDPVLSGVVYPQGVGRLSAALINLIDPEAGARAVGNAVQSPRARLDIVRGCDGSGVLFIVAAATLAFAASLRHTLAGLLLGLSLVYVLNQIRIVGLYFVVAHRLDWFPLLHGYVAPSLIIALVVVYFSWWTRWASRPSAAAAP